MRYYLNFPESLTQIWLHKYIIVLILLIFKVLLFTKTLARTISSNKSVANHACQSYHSFQQQAAQVPSMATEIIDNVVETFVQNLKHHVLLLLSMTISIIKSFISFLIELYLGTLTCLCTAFTKGALHILTDATRHIVDSVDHAVNEFLKAFNKSLGGLSTLVNGVITTFQAIKSLFSHKKVDDLSSAVNEVNLTASTIKNISIPTGFIDDLSNLTHKIPDFEDVLSNFTHFVNSPLDLLQKDIKSHVAVNDTSWKPLSLSIKSSQNVSSSCTQLDHDFDHAVKIIHQTSHWITIGLCIAILVTIAALSLAEYRHWKRKQQVVAEMTLTPDQTSMGNLLDASKNRLWSVIMRTSINYRLKWLLNYCFTATATTVLLIGLAGILVVGLQYVLLSLVKHKLGDVSHNQQFANNTQPTMDHFLVNTQRALDISLETLNDQLFGSIDNTSEELYEKLVHLEHKLNDTVGSVFGHTPFASVAQTIVYCTIGRKLEKIEHGLQWIHHYLEISSPTLNRGKIEQTVQRSLVGSSQDNEDNGGFLGFVETLINTMVKGYEESLLIELIVSCSLIGAWLLFVIFACSILLFREFINNRVVSLVISPPKPLNDEEKSWYQYPLSDPFRRKTSSIYTDSFLSK